MAKIIAEMSGNHNGSLDSALAIIDSVAESGADYLKIQTYTPDTITLPISGGNFQVSDNHPLWGSKNLYDLYSEAHTPWEWHKRIFQRANELGLIAFSTPFDESAVQFLEELDVPLYKIASLEIVDLPLIQTVASTRKPMIISTGTARLDEIAAAVSAARMAGCKDLTLMVCTSSYPALAEDSNLSRMKVLKEVFNVRVGFSDHTKGINVALAAIALGADFIEKHVTLNRADGGVDSDFSAEPGELKQLVLGAKEVSASIGKPHLWGLENEAESIKHRPSLYISKDVEVGELISPENVRSVRPSGGLDPKYIDICIGMRFTKAAHMGTPLGWGLVTESIESPNN